MNLNLVVNNPSLMVLGGVLGILGLALVVYGIAAMVKRARTISDRVEHFVGAQVQVTSESPAAPIVSREISGSLVERTIGQGINKIIQFLAKFTPQKMAEKMEHKLTIAGNPGNMHASGFIALRFFLFIGGVLLAFLINPDINNTNLMSLIFGLLIIVIFAIFPGVWLNARARSRQFEITRGLPDALDILSVCVSAGLAFDQALQKICEFWDTELGRELRRVTQEMEMGVPRGTALTNMSKRLDVDDLSRFIATIVQAEKIGMSYAEVLHSQALQMRILRQLRAREIANQLPGKMIIPVALLIFPAMIAVILGPAIPNLLDFF